MTTRVLESTTRPETQAASLPYLGAALPIGLTGATAVALLLLLLDALAGHPLATPNLLGAAWLRGEAVALGVGRIAVANGFAAVVMASMVALRGHGRRGEHG